MGDLASQLIVALLVLAAGGVFGVLGFFFARAINQSDRTTNKQSSTEVTLARLATRMDTLERDRDPLMLREENTVEHQRTLAYDQNKIREELGRVRTDVAAVEGDLTGKLNSFMAEVRATFTSINDRLASRDVIQAETQTTQREILDKVNNLSVAIARMEARLEPQAPQVGALTQGERRVLEMLSQLAATKDARQ